jgi:prepilin-type N-terminal cleavage/methylation domain-containing protein
MITTALLRTARSFSRGGFTLVELLVVIGIIAILAGVALGPITSGIKKAQQSSGVQTSRTLGLAEFQYANDNSIVYPSGMDAGAVATELMNNNYISDPSIFYISSSAATKYTGTASGTVSAANVSWDFGVQAITTAGGLNANSPDLAPLVVSTSKAVYAFSPSAGTASTATGVDTAAPFGTAGLAVMYKSNSSKFITATSPTSMLVNLSDTTWPGYTMVMAPGCQ